MLVAGKFRVRKMLGGGGFGQIFEVFDEVYSMHSKYSFNRTVHA